MMLQIITPDLLTGIKVYWHASNKHVYTILLDAKQNINKPSLALYNINIQLT